MSSPFPITDLAAARNLRIYRDPCWSDAKRAEREWFLEIRGVGGVLYGNNATSFYVETTPRRAPAFVSVVPNEARYGDDVVRILYGIDALDAVLALLKPRKRKNLTPEQRNAISERLLAARKSTQERARTT